VTVLTPSLETLVAEFGKLPGIGRKTALRMAMHVLGSGREPTLRLAEALRAVVERSRFCSVCGNLCEEDPCAICSNPRRDHGLICAVEQLSDLLALERSGEYRGVYHVLGGVLSPLDGVGPEDLRIEDLLRRIRGGEVKEVILATNATVEGDATALYLLRKLEDQDLRVSRLARGVPMGGNLDYVDQLTLVRALDGRERIR